MAVMSSLREKTHIILYGLLAAFLVLIVFEWGMNFTGKTGKKENLAGKVNGTAISLSQYEEITNNLRRSNPKAETTPEDELKLQEQVWSSIVDLTLLDQQFEKFGITLLNQEVEAALDGTKPTMEILRNFADPTTRVIDHKMLDLARHDPRYKMKWGEIEKNVRRELKLRKLITAWSTFARVTDREVGDMVNRQYQHFSASFIPFPLSLAGTESNFPVKEEEIKKYYDDHKEPFKQLPSRKADFVFFPLAASSKDSLAIRTELETIRTEFNRSVNDSSFVSVQSDHPTEGINVTYSRADFSPEAGLAVFTPSNLKPDAITAPVADRGEYRLIKIKKVVSLPLPVARASHILLRFNPASREEVLKVQELSLLIYKQLQAGVPFDALAKKYSADPGSASNGGDIGWFTKERMLPEFSAAVFNATPGTIIGRPVQTQYGIHIIKVTGFDHTGIVCSEVVRNIKPSTETMDSERRLAIAFQLQAKENGFEKSATSEKLTIEKTAEFGQHTPVAPIGYSDKITAFAFKASEGDLSDVIETEKGFFILRLTARNDTGYRLLDKDLKTMITTELVREKMGAALEKKIAAMAKGAGMTLEKIAAANPGMQVVTADDIRWSDAVIPGYGVDRPLVEAMSGVVPGKLSAPVKTTNGYALVLVSKKLLPPDLDPKAAKAVIAPQLLKVKQEQLFAEYFASVRKSAKIEDLRP